jgi:hypothetical protein
MLIVAWFDRWSNALRPVDDEEEDDDDHDGEMLLTIWGRTPHP